MNRFHAVALGICLLFTSTMSAANYEPQLPKVQPGIEKVIALDVTQDKRADPSLEVIYTITAFQGLINRSSTTKVYLVNPPITAYVDSVWEGRDASRQQLTDGLIPGEHVDAKLDRQKRYPALCWMLEHYGHLLECRVLVPSIRDIKTYAYFYDRKKDGAPPIDEDILRKGNGTVRAAALNCVTFDNALFVAESIDDYVRKEGYQLDILVDMREMDMITAFQWACDRYLGDARRNRKVVGLVGGLPFNRGAMWDYFVATYAFNLSVQIIGIQDGAEIAARKALYAQVLNQQNYEKGILVVGLVESVAEYNTVCDLGYCGIDIPFPNGSVTAATPTRISAKPVRPKTAPIDPNGLYMTVQCLDADGLAWLTGPAYDSLRNDPEVDNVRHGWKMNLHMLDFYPPLVDYYLNRNPETVEIVAESYTSWPTFDPDGVRYWARMHNQYVETCNGSVTTLHFMGRNTPGTRRKFGDILAGTKVQYVFFGYGIGPDVKPTWNIYKGIVFSNTIGGSSRGEVHGLARDIAKSIRQHAVPGEPYFINARLGVNKQYDANCKRGEKAATMTKELIELCESDKSIDRPIYLLLPRDIAATYKKWCEQK